MLGEFLPPLTLLCKDSLGNSVPRDELPPIITIALKPPPPREAPDIDVQVSIGTVGLPPLGRLLSTVEHVPLQDHTPLASATRTSLHSE